MSGRPPSSAASRTRWYLAFVLLSVSVTVALSAVYLRSALRHRAAVSRGAHDFALQLLREIADTLEIELATNSTPLYRLARAVTIASPVSARPGGPGIGPTIVEALGAYRDSIAECGCGPAARIRAVRYWDRESRELSSYPSSQAEGVRAVLERAESDPRFAGTQIFSLTGAAGEPPSYLHLLPNRDARGRSGALVIDFDLDSLAAGVHRSYERVLKRYLVDQPVGAEVPGSLIRVTLQGGAPLLAVGTNAGSVTEVAWSDGESLETGSIGMTLSVGRPVLGRVFPGGMPSSPWPLAVGSIVLSGLLAALALLTLRRFDRLVALREEFVSNVTHEIRTPITQILLYGETLQLERPTPEARRRAADVIVREAHRLSRLVENALAFAKGQRPTVGLEPAVVDLGGAVEAAASELRNLLTQRQVRLDLQCDPGVLVSIDQGALRQIVGNLSENAAVHGPIGQVISISVTSDASGAKLLVADQGPGIPPKLRDRIFEPFFRGNGSSGGTGTGLGLSIVRQLVELHGGTIAVGDQVGGGSQFEIRLPMVR